MAAAGAALVTCARTGSEAESAPRRSAPPAAGHRLAADVAEPAHARCWSSAPCRLRPSRHHALQCQHRHPAGDQVDRASLEQVLGERRGLFRPGRALLRSK
jgi:hypothetical protein